MNGYLRNVVMFIVLLGVTACATSPKKGVSDEFTKKDLILAAIKLDPTFINRWSDTHVDGYIQKVETSPLWDFLPKKTPSNSEFEKRENMLKRERERKEVREKLLAEAENFDLNKEYLYSFSGVVMGEYDFTKQSIPLPGFGNFYFTYDDVYPGTLFVNFPESFTPEIKLDPEKAKTIVESSLHRHARQQRKVYPMVTFKLVSSSTGDKQAQQEAWENYQTKRDSISRMDNSINQLEKKIGAYTGRGSSRTQNVLNDLNSQYKTRKAMLGEKIEAVVTSVVIYRQPFEYFINQEILYKKQFDLTPPAN